MNNFDSQFLNYDNLITDATVKPTTGSEVLLKGNKLSRGAVLGYVKDQAKVTLVDKTGKDGRELVYAVLAQDVDATNADVKVPVYYSGGFNTHNLTFANKDTPADHKYSARQVAIFFNNVPRG